MNRVHLLLRLLATGLLMIWAGLALAQMSSEARSSYDDWLKTAEQAEKIIDAGEAPTPELESLRAEIANYREQFIVGRDQNADRIKTLQSQLDALGPVPESGEEPEDIAALRQSLTDQLDGLRVPRVVSEEAFNRANGLISEIDRIIRERQASQLLARGPSPLNVTHWPEAISDIRRSIGTLVGETRSAWNSEEKRTALKSMLPALIVTSLVGLLLIVRGSKWSRWLGDYLRRFGGKGTGIWSFVVSLARIVLPYVGIVLLCIAAILSGLPGERGQLLIAKVPQWGLTFLTFKWLADQIVFNESGTQLQFRKPYHRSETRFLVLLLAMMLILYGSIQFYEEVENLSAASRAFVGFWPVLASALILLRLQRIAINPAKVEEDADDDQAHSAGVPKLISGLRRGVTLMALASPILAVFGYMNAAEAIIYPAIKTLFLISAFIILQRFLCDLYGWLSGKGEAAKDSLFAVVAGFLLALLSVPLLAIVWGTRIADLTELWEQFIAGFTIGGVNISPVNFITFAAIFAIGYSVTKLIQGGLRINLLPKTGIDPGGQNAIVSGVGYIGIFLAALIAITGAGIDLSSLAIVAGALSVGIGFGLQTIVSNFVSGIILLVERPISKGDWIEVGGLMGYVRDISVRSTRIETFDRTDVIIPNSDLISGTVTNYTRGNTIGRVITPVGVAYGTDTKRVEKILLEIANAHPMVLANPPPNVVFQGFGADSLDFEIRAILRDVNWVLSVKSDMNHEIARRFAQEGIEIPFAQRDVWLRNPEVLHQRPSDGEDNDLAEGMV
jgi:small-conductance mechanosensitive channel